jgi:hypothetical protein
MCLYNVKETFDPNDDIVLGYKVMTDPNTFENSQNWTKGKTNCYLNLIRHDEHGVKKLGQHRKAKSRPKKIINFNNEEYDNGFHIYNNLKDAKIVYKRYPKHRKIIRVIGWDIRAIGIERIWKKVFSQKEINAKVIVTKNIRYMEEVPCQK